MIKFLAVIAFCIEGECMFWADTDKPYYTPQECEAKIEYQMYYMSTQGVRLESMVPGCIPTKFYKTEA
jgi:hypothetical protein